MADSGNSPFGMTGLPGSNPGGSMVPAPMPSSASPSGNNLGSQGNNPLVPAPVTGQNLPGMSSSVNGATNASGTAGLDVASLLGFGQGGGNTNASGGWAPNMNDFVKAFKKAGFSAGDAALLYNFLQSGAGYNPQVAQALIAAMQPGIQKGQADIMEQFSSMGLTSSSPAALGFADYMSNVQLNEGQIFANLYEQSVQNYLNVLLAGKGQYKSTFDNLISYVTAGSGAIKAAGAAGSG
jgi:hypothetical protein